MISRKKARDRIMKFAKKHEGQDIEIDQLKDKELYDFILADTYLKVDALLGYDADVNIILDRAIEKAEKNKNGGFVEFRNGNKGKSFRIL